tara:strand:- start:986 stop:1192 length:207 start_codon:yes stop_codon:yes gene_type:complete
MSKSKIYSRGIIDGEKMTLERCDCDNFHTCYDCGSMAHKSIESVYIITKGIFKNLFVCRECKDKEYAN